MSIARGWILACAIVLGLPKQAPAQEQRAADTVDVPVGSDLIDGARARAHVVHAEQLRLSGDSAVSMAAMTWTIASRDSAGVRLRTVHGEGDSPRPDGSIGHPSIDYTLDLGTLAPRTFNVHQRGGGPGPVLSLTFDGASVRGDRSTGGSAQPVDVTLPRAAFLASLADLVAEALPRRTGSVYRVLMWQPGMGEPVTHLYQTLGREDVDVLGVTYRGAWIVVDKGTDGAELGRMWMVDHPPYMVRWNFVTPTGDRMRLDQRLENAAPKH